MIRDLLISFKDNLKERTTNPFLGLYFSVLVVRNWEILYSIFNFDEQLTLSEKLKYINNYLVNNSFLHNLWLNLLWTFLILIITYSAINLSRLIINLFEKKLTPWIYKMTDRSSIVLKTIYDKVILERDEIQTRLDNERELKLKLESRIKLLEDQLLEIAQKNIEDSQNEIISSQNNTKNESDEISIVYNKLIKSNLIDEFLSISTQILKKNTVRVTPEVEKFMNWNLIEYQSAYSEDYSFYTLTGDGNKILRMARLDEAIL